MKYRVHHTTTFSYAYPVASAHQLLHLLPRDRPNQRVLDARLEIEPVPDTQDDRLDYFGNRVLEIVSHEAHDRMTIDSVSLLDVTTGDDILLDLSPAWETVALALLHPANADQWDASRYAFPSPQINPVSVRDFAEPFFAAGEPFLRAVMNLTESIYEEFDYQGGVTDVFTPVSAVLKHRRGVCQDFAHLAIGAVRSMGLPARYVSGYLLTHPAPGSEKLIGADASHAWLSVWCPEFGWVDFDPTNNMRPADEHIVVGWGRDYSDVSPTKGVIHGGGRQTLKVAVDVRPLG